MSEKVVAEMTANVWKVLVRAGDRVEPGQELLILESMKMEIPMISESGGTIESVLVQEGDAVAEGDPLILVGS